jgi:hypothetical protein
MLHVEAASKKVDGKLTKELMKMIDLTQFVTNNKT